MLSERDQRILREIEQHLLAEERRMAAIAGRAWRSERRLRRATDAALVVAALAAGLCFVLATAVTVGAGVVATVLFTVLALVSVHGRRRRRTGAPLQHRWTRPHRGRARW